VPYSLEDALSQKAKITVLENTVHTETIYCDRCDKDVEQPVPAYDGFTYWLLTGKYKYTLCTRCMGEVYEEYKAKG